MKMGEADGTRAINAKGEGDYFENICVAWMTVHSCLRQEFTNRLIVLIGCPKLVDEVFYQEPYIFSEKEICNSGGIRWKSPGAVGYSKDKKKIWLKKWLLTLLFHFAIISYSELEFHCMKT
jgi:hypothetical protein